jgi:Cys-tRNA(Pro) deacylase
VAVTSAIRELRKHSASFTEHEYRYEDHGGTASAARQLGVDEHAVVKTLIMEDENARPLVVLMHGDREVSTKQLARQTGRKSIRPCEPATAQRHTGYMVGGTSPFGTLKRFPVFVERSILDLPTIYINGGRRGFLVGIAPAEAVRILGATPVDAAQIPGV